MTMMTGEDEGPRGADHQEGDGGVERPTQNGHGLGPKLSIIYLLFFNEFLSIQVPMSECTTPFNQ